MSYKFAGWLSSSWVDPRLAFAPRDLLWLNSISVRPGSAWDPYVAIDSRSDSFASVSSTSGGYRVQIFPNGIVKKSTWVSGRVGCSMDLSKHPANTQRCVSVGWSLSRH